MIRLSRPIDGPPLAATILDTRLLRLTLVAAHCAELCPESLAMLRSGRPVPFDPVGEAAQEESFAAMAAEAGERRRAEEAELARYGLTREGWVAPT